MGVPGVQSMERGVREEEGVSFQKRGASSPSGEGHLRRRGSGGSGSGEGEGGSLCGRGGRGATIQEGGSPGEGEGARGAIETRGRGNSSAGCVTSVLSVHLTCDSGTRERKH